MTLILKFKLFTQFLYYFFHFFIHIFISPL
nr:MAG TPA: hypothetical protein [Caudoviricetes sp.]